jgi:hypothetical protein
MTTMIFTYEFKDGSLIELTGSKAKYWSGFGLPDFEGDLNGFALQFPDHIQVLLDKKIVRK